MAKVVFPATVSGIIGTVGTGVYYRSTSTKVGYLRSWVMPAYSASNAERAGWVKNLKLIWYEAANAYKAELALYAQKYKDLPVYGDPMATRTKSRFAIWYMMMVNWSLLNPSVDLKTLTDEDFGVTGSQVMTIANAVKNGCLPSVEGYAAFTEDMLS